MKSEATVETAEELRPLLHGKIDQLDKDSLALVHRVLLQIEASLLAEKITSDLAKDEKFFDGIEDTILEFRKKHPYR